MTSASTSSPNGQPPPEPREVTDADGVLWTCIQAFEGLGRAAPKEDAARIAGSDRVAVTCTPSGGARSRRLALLADWRAMTDEALLGALADGDRHG